MKKYTKLAMTGVGIIASLAMATQALAALTLTSTTVTSDGTLSLQGTALTLGASGVVATFGDKIVLSPTFSGSSSAQSVEADATLSSFTGGYGAGAMGNVMGTVGAGDSIIAGVIGKYNVGTNPSDHPAAGLVGEVGEDSANTADAAILAVLGGDSGALTAGAAYGVRYLNSTLASKFTYGLDLYSAAVDSYQPVTFGTADIRLQKAATIDNSVSGTLNLTATTVKATGAFQVTGVSSLATTSVTSALNKGTVTLSGGTGTATVAAGSVCVVSETTDETKTVKGVVSSTTLTITGTGTDVIAYLCF